MIFQIIIYVILVSIGLLFFRLIKGPTVPDRITAGDSIGIMFLSIILLLGLIHQADAFVDVALVYSILLFVDVLIMSKYLGSREVKDDD